MSRIAKEMIVRLAVCALAAGLAASPALAIKVAVATYIYWDATGDANPNLHYWFESLNRTTFSEFNSAEAVVPVTLTGQLMRNQNTQMEYCTDGGLVNHVFFECYTKRFTISCPKAEGTYQAITRTTAYEPPLGSIFAGASDTVIANCPPISGPQCLLGIQSDVTKMISLESGLPVDSTASSTLPPVRLKRRSVDHHGEFMLEEWAIVEPGQSGLVLVLDASSQVYGKILSAEPDPILKALASGQAHEEPQARLVQKPGQPRKYLVVQGSGHKYTLIPPLVKFVPPRLHRVQSSELSEVVAIRMMFDHSGEVQDFETLFGSSSYSSQLSGAIDLQFLPGAEHRVALFTVFEVPSNGADPILLSAVPVLPKCCCGQLFCA